MNSTTCNTCGSTLEGKFCHNCGEKVLHVQDFSMKKFVTNTVDIFTHFDGKFFLSFKYLLFYPGKLTNEFINGRRVKLMKPLQLYIVIAIVFFFLFKGWDILFTRLQFMLVEKGQAAGQPQYYKQEELKGYQLWMQGLVKKKAEKHDSDYLTQLFKIDAGLPDKSKAFAFLIIPILALSIYAVGFRKYRWYAIHLVHATHLLCFLFAFAVIWIGGYELLCKLFHLELQYSYAFVPLLIVFIIYLFLSLQNVLQPKRYFNNLLNCIVVLGGFLFVVVAYRSLITIIATALS